MSDIPPNMRSTVAQQQALAAQQGLWLRQQQEQQARQQAETDRQNRMQQDYNNRAKASMDAARRSNEPIIPAGPGYAPDPEFDRMMSWTLGISAVSSVVAALTT